MQRALVCSGQKLRINDAGVGVERDIFGQAVVVDAGHHGALFRDGCFFFDDGGHDDCALDLARSWVPLAKLRLFLGFDARRAQGVGCHRVMDLNQSDLVRYLTELLDHGRRHLLHGHHAGEFIGIGEKVAFERVGARGEVGDHRGVGLRHFQEILSGSEAGGLDRRGRCRTW